MKHTRLQQTVFFQSINNVIDNKFLSLELRSRKKGMDISTKKYLNTLDDPDLTGQQAYRYLWVYAKVHELNQDNINHALKDVEIDVENYQQSLALIDELNVFLEKLGLDTF